MTSPSYAGSGVDIRLGDQASQLLFSAAQKTWENRKGKFGEIKALDTHFRTSRFFEATDPSGKTCLGCNFDGIGTKIELAERLRSFDNVAFDLLAMVCDDAAVQGAEPVHVGSVLDVGKIDLEIIEQLAVGLVAAAADAGVAVVNGELAELPGRISGYGVSPLNWSGACFWAANLDKIRSWERAIPGDVVIGVAERGFRSNGFTLLRTIFRNDGGPNWGAGSDRPLLDLIRFAAQPSIIYSRYIQSLTGGLTGIWTDGLRGFVHVTGGGLLGRILFYCKTNKVRLRVGDNARPPLPMCHICELGNVDMEEAYRTWNMGLGLIVICDKKAADMVIRRAETFPPIQASVIGCVQEGSGLAITFYDGKTREFSA